MIVIFSPHLFLSRFFSAAVALPPPLLLHVHIFIPQRVLIRSLPVRSFDDARYALLTCPSLQRATVSPAGCFSRHNKSSWLSPWFVCFPLWRIGKYYTYYNIHTDAFRYYMDVFRVDGSRKLRIQLAKAYSPTVERGMCACSWHS